MSFNFLGWYLICLIKVYLSTQQTLCDSNPVHWKMCTFTKKRKQNLSLNVCLNLLSFNPTPRLEVKSMSEYVGLKSKDQDSDSDSLNICLNILSFNPTPRLEVKSTLEYVGLKSKDQDSDSDSFNTCLNILSVNPTPRLEVKCTSEYVEFKAKHQNFYPFDPIFLVIPQHYVQFLLMFEYVFDSNKYQTYTYSKYAHFISGVLNYFFLAGPRPPS